MKKIISISILIGLCSCERESAVKFDSNFIGEWTYIEELNKGKTLNIGSDSKGDILYSGGYTQRRKWWVKDDYLIFGLSSKKSFESFHIDTFPQEATFVFPNFFDSVQIGQKYMWLDGNLYVDD